MLTDEYWNKFQGIAGLEQLKEKIKNSDHSYQLVILFDVEKKMALLKNVKIDSWVVAKNIYQFENRIVWDYGHYFDTLQEACEYYLYL